LIVGAASLEKVSENLENRTCQVPSYPFAGKRSTLHPNVLTQYDLGRIHSVQTKSGGGVDESFIVVCDGGRYFFKRRALNYTPEMIECDHALVQFLVDEGFPTPAVVPTRNGCTWVEQEGRLYEAYTYVEGEGFASGDIRQMSSLGRTVGKYHRLVASYRPPRIKLPPWQDTSISGFLGLSGYVAFQLETLLPRGWIGEPEVQLLRELTQQLKGQGQAISKETGVISLTVHGALEPGNVLFDQAGRVIAVVDWADSAQFARVFDVAHALLKFGGRRPDAVLPGQVGPTLPWSSVESFANAYRQLVQLLKLERALLPWVMLACRLADALWIDERYVIDYRRELHQVSGLRAWLMDNRTALQQLFC
jgi:Ser/Thr protein kinase RdoA (MazF antagonist)